MASLSSSSHCFIYNSDTLCITCPRFPLTSATTSLLQKPPKFVPTPTGCCHPSIMRGVEDFLRRYKWQCFFAHRPTSLPRFPLSTGSEPPATLVAPAVVRNCNRILVAVKSLLARCSHCFPPDNLSTEERSELDRLRRDTSVVVSPADKGGKWVIVPRADYDAEAFKQLRDEDFYQPVKSSLQTSVRNRLVNFLIYLRRTGFLTRRECRALAPPNCPREREFYLTPKIHKAVWPSTRMPPGRPIVSDVQSTSRLCASLIEYFLAPLAQLAESYVRDSMHVIARLDDVRVISPVILFTFDISALYTNIPPEDGIAAVSRAFLRNPDLRRPDLTILSMLRLLLSTNDFSFRGERFLQTHGTAMGCAFGASYANIYLSEWDQAIHRHPLTPLVWLRFIDDVFGVWTHGEEQLLSFRDFINTIYPSINVTLSYSVTSVHFLDLELYLSLDRIFHRIAFKSTNSFNILPVTSFHAQHTFQSIVHSQVYRWCVHSSTYSDFKHTKSVVQAHWRRQGYTRSKVRAAVKNIFCFTGFSPTNWQPGFFSCDTCVICKYSFYTSSVRSGKSLFPILHSLTCFTTGVIYLIRCKNCNIQYVGETSRTLQHRIAEHVLNVRNGVSTSVARHFTSTCSLDHFSFTALEHQVNTTKRRNKELLWVRRLRTATPEGLNVLTRSYRSLPLVLPLSNCSKRVVRLCQKATSDTKVVGAFRAPKNLARQLSDFRSRPDP